MNDTERNLLVEVARTTAALAARNGTPNVGALYEMIDVVAGRVVQKAPEPPTPPQPQRRAHLRPDGIPTRVDMALMSDAELAISHAMTIVERAGASAALTDANNYLVSARNRVADHVEGDSSSLQAFVLKGGLSAAERPESSTRRIRD